MITHTQVDEHAHIRKNDKRSEKKLILQIDKKNNKMEKVRKTKQFSSLVNS